MQFIFVQLKKKKYINLLVLDCISPITPFPTVIYKSYMLFIPSFHLFVENAAERVGRYIPYSWRVNQYFPDEVNQYFPNSTRLKFFFEILHIFLTVIVPTDRRTAIDSKYSKFLGKKLAHTHIFSYHSSSKSAL